MEHNRPSNCSQVHLQNYPHGKYSYRYMESSDRVGLSSSGHHFLCQFIMALKLGAQILPCIVLHTLMTLSGVPYLVLCSCGARSRTSRRPIVTSIKVNPVFVINWRCASFKMVWVSYRYMLFRKDSRLKFCTYLSVTLFSV